MHRRGLLHKMLRAAPRIEWPRSLEAEQQRLRVAFEEAICKCSLVVFTEHAVHLLHSEGLTGRVPLNAQALKLERGLC